MIEFPEISLGGLGFLRPAHMMNLSSSLFMTHGGKLALPSDVRVWYLLFLLRSHEYITH